MKEKDCELEIKEVERKFDMCLDVSRSISITYLFLLLSFILASFTAFSTRTGLHPSISDSLSFHIMRSKLTNGGLF